MGLVTMRRGADPDDRMRPPGRAVIGNRIALRGERLYRFLPILGRFRRYRDPGVLSILRPLLLRT
jgi:hypothetical protein